MRLGGDLKLNKCKHEKITDLSQGKKEHLFCLGCKSHWYKNKYWSKLEWEKYVNLK